MEALRIGCATVGLVLYFICWFWMVVLAFRENRMFGYGVFFIPILGVVFGLMHWDEAKIPVSGLILSMAFLGIAAIAV